MSTNLSKKALLEEQIKQMGFSSIEEAIEATKNIQIKEPIEPAWSAEDTEKEPQEIKEISPVTTNICFMAAQTAGNTKVFAFDPSREDNYIELQGVSKAVLNYDPELDFPILTLEIINPFIP